MKTFPELVDGIRPGIEGSLDRQLPSTDEAPRRLHEAMRYAIFAGGKRVRPALVILVGEAFGAEPEPLLPVAAAVEMLHTYSLIHDDLPAMDDDDLRRGQPTVHRRYDEAIAVLAGDALLTRGLQLLALHPSDAPPERRLRALARVAEAIGSLGMIGGQADDLAAESAWPQEPKQALDRIHDRKTGALLAVCLELGGLFAGADAAELARLSRLGGVLGRMFQVADDMLDCQGSEEALGKAVGKDAAARKLTYPALFGLDGSRDRLRELRDRALALAAELPGGAGLWSPMIHYFGSRDR